MPNDGRSLKQNKLLKEFIFQQTSLVPRGLITGKSRVAKIPAVATIPALTISQAER